MILEIEQRNLQRQIVLNQMAIIMCLAEKENDPDMKKVLSDAISLSKSIIGTIDRSEV